MKKNNVWLERSGITDNVYSRGSFVEKFRLPFDVEFVQKFFFWSKKWKNSWKGKGKKKLLLLMSDASACVCVCVCVRDREWALFKMPEMKQEETIVITECRAQVKMSSFSRTLHPIRHFCVQTFVKFDILFSLMMVANLNWKTVLINE